MASKPNNGCPARQRSGLIGWILTGLVGVSLIGLLPEPSHAAACKLRAGYDPYGVYAYTDEQGRAAGIDIDVIRAFAKELSCQVSFVEMPWSRVLLAIEAGELDLTSSSSLTPERQAFARFSIPYRQADVAIYVRRGEADRFKLGALGDVAAAGLRLGVIKDYYYGEDYEDLLGDDSFVAMIDPAADYDTNIRKLIHGRIDGFIVDDAGVMVSVIDSLGVKDQVERHPLALPGDDLHFMFSRKSIDALRVEGVNHVLKRMADDGRLHAIMKRHLE